MTGSKLYIDTAPFIYFLEKSSLYFEQIRKFFIDCKNTNAQLSTSAVTVEEYCVYPLSQKNNQAVSNFEKFLDGMEIKVIPVDKTVALEAAELRAKYPALKALDAIHLATSIINECSAFITNDKRLQQTQEISVVTTADLAKTSF